ncbi:DNA/RNA non-specific endonuclease [Rhodovulum sp. DZ06]|uniref:DNA/RNA non-specific endonuclease n=1 Tax=Rhodovulum sp. DZ06 TaxID=3425126 RepID=UPI003D3274BD
MSGYDPNFLDLDHPVDLPGFGPELSARVRRAPTLRDEVYADYIHYTVAMHAAERTPLFAALNIDQNQLRQAGGHIHWKTDSRVGDDFQLASEYYGSTWNKGHLARRAASAWGADNTAAKRASDATFFYTNACLQHRNFNPDEWLALEDWVKDLDEDADGKICVFSGPVWAENPRAILPAGRPKALIPTAFFKVVAWKGKDGKLAVRAFLAPQDAGAMEDRKGRRKLENFQRYQVSVTEIEEQTGLVFDDRLPAENPIYFNEAAAARDLGVTHFPERIEVDDPVEVVAPGEARDPIFDDVVDVFIAAAMVDPAGPERGAEWVSVINLSGAEVDLAGWSLRDAQSVLPLSGVLEPGVARRVQPLSPLRLANTGGFLALFDGAGRRIDRVRYGRLPKSREGRPVIFARRDEETL